MQKTGQKCYRGWKAEMCFWFIQWKKKHKDYQKGVRKGGSLYRKVRLPFNYYEIQVAAFSYQDSKIKILKLKKRNANVYFRKPSTKMCWNLLYSWCAQPPQSHNILYPKAKVRTDVWNIQARSNRKLSEYTDSETEESEAMIHMKFKK